jgi:3-oxoadipate enol-lactonase
VRGLLLAASGLLLTLTPISQIKAQGKDNAATTRPGEFVDVPGGKLYYQECGSGSPTVMLIHDGVVNSAVWNLVWPAFCQHFHTIRYDRRGYGRSPSATTGYWETDDLAAVLRQLRVSKLVLVGSSHGGELSLDFTLTYPQVVQQLVLVGPVVSGMTYTQQFFDRGKVPFALLAKGDLQGAIAEWSKDKYLIAPGDTAGQKRLFDLLSANPQDMSHQEVMLSPKPALPRLHEIHVPTLILVGDADIPDVHAHVGAIEAGIPNARRVLIDGVGHVMYLEKPEEFSRTVIQFIETNCLDAKP